MPTALSRLLPGLVLLVLAPLLRAAPADLIVASDLLKLKSIESPALSPDGKLAAYVVRAIEPKPADPAAKEPAGEDWIYTTQVWLAATDGKTPPRQLTRGSAAHAAPAWHPDGRQLAFVRTVDKEKPQIYLLSLDGGEARALTKLDTGATTPRWSPDGSKLLFTSVLTEAQIRAALTKAGTASSPTWSPERPGRTPHDTANWRLKPAPKDAPKPTANPDGPLAERREWLARNEADNNPRQTTRLNFLAETDLQPDLSFAQLYVLDLKAGAEPRLVAPAFAARGTPAWLTDSRHVVCTVPRSPTEHPDRQRFRSLAVIDTTTSEIRTILDRADENYGDPAPSPDGRWIAFTLQTGGEFSFDQPKVALLPVGGGAVRVLSDQLDRSAQNLRWNRDASALYFTAASEGRFPLYRIPLPEGNVQLLTWQTWGIRSFDVGPDGLVQVVTAPENPAELHSAHLSGKISHRLTTHNADWLATKRLATYEPRDFTTPDGLRINAWLLKPTDFDPAKKYPLFVQIHGGPSAMWGPGEDSMWFEFQFYAARGYGIVFSNPRGSGGYGRDFQRANYRNWGTGPAADVLQAADLAAQEPWVDRNRQVLTGGSYGGYLTAWIVAHDHRFKAAVAQRGVYDLQTFYGEGNAWFLVPLYWGGQPWEPEIRRLLERDSPLTYVAQIKTPLLIQHGDVDFRTGVMQSQMLYKSLKALGRPVEYVRYPHASHEMSRAGEPRQRLDSLVRYEEFFRRFIGE